jgi:exodeoxyribonuclease V alpha subunit
VIETTDPFDVRFARRAPGLLRTFNEAGVLAPADVHVAARLAALAGEADDEVILAAALAVRAPRLGHVYVDIAAVRTTATVEDGEDPAPADLSGLPWPEPDGWRERVAGSPLVAGGAFRLEGSALYLDRYWREEVQIAADLVAFGSDAARAAGAGPPGGAAGAAGLAGLAGPRADLAVLRSGLRRLFPADADEAQRLAAASAVLRRLAVVAGGPGTGKTTTVARIVALLCEQAEAAGAPAPLVALAAPTGKAQSRLVEAVHEEAGKIAVSGSVRAYLLELEASTLHRLLGWRPGSHSRFRHHRGNRLPHDVVIVDETSMVSLSLMARLVEAVRPDARLILVGDPGQLASIEAGAVLGDIVGPAAEGLRMRPAARAALADAVGAPVSAAEATSPVGDGIVVLDRVHRYGTAIADVASAIRAGDADALIANLQAGAEGVTWLPVDVAEEPEALGPVREGAVATARTVIEAARDGRAAEAIHALGAHRVLCAHRQGPHGVASWMARIEAWIAAEAGDFAGEAWYPGRPLLVTENDYGLRLFNGDTGVVVAAGGRAVAAFERRDEIVEFSPARLSAVETVYAMTVHKAQGSQFGTAAVLLPAPSSQVLTRELLYTAVTRARERLILAGTEEAIRAAVARPVARASGLRARLWG